MEDRQNTESSCEPDLQPQELQLTLFVPGAGHLEGAQTKPAQNPTEYGMLQI